MHPLGLVAKGSVWYLVAGTDAGLRTFRVNRVRSVVVIDEPVQRPDGFDLAETWESVKASIDERRAGFRAVARADAETVGWLRSAFGTRVSVGNVAVDGRLEVQIRSWSAHTVAAELASFGARVEVLEPAEVRDELERLGTGLTTLYGRSRRSVRR